MLSPIMAVAAGEETNLVQLAAIWQEVRQGLDAKKGRIVDEIMHYPAPIPACDAQFNGLLEDRAAILQEIGQVQEVLKASPPISEQRELLNNLLRSSPYLDAEVKEQIRQWLSAG